MRSPIIGEDQVRRSAPDGLGGECAFRAPSSNEVNQRRGPSVFGALFLTPMGARAGVPAWAKERDRNSPARLGTRDREVAQCVGRCASLAPTSRLTRLAA